MSEHPLGRNAHLFQNLNRRSCRVWIQEEVLTRLPLVTLVAVALGTNVLSMLM
jgi:hypothetical protein